MGGYLLPDRLLDLFLAFSPITTHGKTLHTAVALSDEAAFVRIQILSHRRVAINTKGHGDAREDVLSTIQFLAIEVRLTTTSAGSRTRRLPPAVMIDYS
jgi:hypothetical protein